ncbi:MAG: DUF2092 domain-containing protein [Chloroflexi bacterium]|nr:DUF2092 domain-containing protein [Chloroflexota bacterium]
MKHIKLLAPVALLLVLAAALSACTPGQQMSASDIIQKMRDTMQTTQTAQGTIDLSLTINKDGLKALASGLMPGRSGDSSTDGWTAKLPNAASITLKSWHQSPDKARLEVDSSTIPGLKGDVVVYDGQKLYAYDTARNTIYTATPSEMQQLPDMMKELAQSGDMQKQIDTLISSADIVSSGSEKVAGYDAYKLDITPKADALQKLNLPTQSKMQAELLLKDLRATLWVDKDRYIPLKLTLTHPSLGQFTYTATSLDLNKPVEASQFVLQVPAGAKSVDLDAYQKMAQPKAITIQQARDIAAKEGYKLLEPSYVTSNATLVQVNQTSGMSGTSGTLLQNYSAPGVNFTITQSKDMQAKPFGDSLSGTNSSDKGAGTTKAVTVRGVAGSAFTPSTGTWTVLAWQEKSGTPFVTISGNVSLDEATKIAEGLK